MTRREFCAVLTAAMFFLAGGTRAARGAAADRTSGDEAAPFSFQWLKAKARALSQKAYVPPDEKLPAWVPADFDGYQAIRFRPQKALWAGQDVPFQVRFFHLGLYYKRAVRLHEVTGRLARPIRYVSAMFRFPPGLESHPGGEPSGFAGFRIHPKEDFDLDEVAFLGASYFRATGNEKQYGLSARGLAIDTGLPRPEEFPDFREFWLERPDARSDLLRVYALLDGPSVAGAYAFDIRTGEPTTMDVDATLFPRRQVERLGIAPMTSMFQYGKNDRRTADNFRPEVHDSDGLALLTGAGEWIWRPLVNPAALRVNSFLDENPRGFGLLQRERDFNNYQDDGARYHKRPSLWAEPLGVWGKGAVQLVEIPTEDETFDNIVAFWNPEDPIEPGHEAVFRYRLSWGAHAPSRPRTAEVLGTRLGRAGGLGRHQAIPGRKFVIDFKGGRLSGATRKDEAAPHIETSRGKISGIEVYFLSEVNAWRCAFDLVYDGKDPVNLRCFLADAKGALTETWMYQWTP